MPIHHMLYRCPRCGQDPLDGHKRRARCSSCGTRFEQGRGSVIVVRPPEGPPEPTAASSLLADVEKMGGPGIKRDLGKDLGEETLFRESRIVFGRAEGHDVIRWRGEVLGFSERISWKGEGLLRLEGEALSFRPGGGSPRDFSVSWAIFEESRSARGRCRSRWSRRACASSSCWMTPRSAGRTFFASH